MLKESILTQTSRLKQRQWPFLTMKKSVSQDMYLSLGSSNAQRTPLQYGMEMKCHIK